MTAEQRELLVRIDERQRTMNETLNKILAEAKSTNGRVTALEAWKNELKGSYEGGLDAKGK